MNQIRKAASLTVGMIFLLMPTVASGQNEATSVKHRNNCRLAGQIIATGHPEPHLSWALGYIGYCDLDSTTPLVIEGMRRLRNASDVATLQRLFSYAVQKRTPDLFRELVGTADDRTASVAARVVALLKLAAIRSPDRVPPPYAEVIGGLDERGEPRGQCHWRIAQHRPLDAPGSLPPDYREQIERLVQRIYADPTERPDVRSAAACI